MISLLSKLFNLLLLLLFVSLTIASPSGNEREPPLYENIVGQASNIIASTILKANIDINKNYVFSPIGYTTLLAILGEGAKDDAHKDIGLLLQHPVEERIVRSAYKNVLQALQNDTPLVAPHLKTWLYIFKNNTVEDDFRTSLINNYYVEVKDVERSNVDEKGSSDMHDVDADSSLTLNDIDDEHISEELIDTVTVTLPVGASGSPNNSKDIPDFETLKKNEPVDGTRTDNQKDASKFDEVVEDRQYVEVPVIKKELLKEQSKLSGGDSDGVDSDDGKTVPPAAQNRVDEASGEVVAKVIEIFKNEPDNVGVPKQVDDLEIMQTAESSRFLLFDPSGEGDEISVMSANSIVGEKENITDGDTSKYESKLILFNGLYFHGMWATPFQQLRHSPDNVFYTSESEKVNVKMMSSRGLYRFAEIKHLNAQALELPYETDRYSLLLVIPNARNGLKKLINDFGPDCLVDISAKLIEESVDVCLPKFRVDTTGGAEKSLAKAGLASIFTSKADFSGISRDQKLHVEEIQQHVSFRVDEGSSTENFLTATNAQRSNAVAERSIVVDRPFLYFVRDHTINLVIVAGKITTLPEYDDAEVDSV